MNPGYLIYISHLVVNICLKINLMNNHLLCAIDAEPLVQVIPHGIESVNGSDVNMGCTSCTSLLVDSDGVMVCMSQSYLVDGCSPAIDTSTSDWASQLVTVRKTQTDELTFDHVLLTFGFDTAVTLTGIELDLFLCPDMNIGAPYITVYADEESNLILTSSSLTSLPFLNYPPDETERPTSCDSLSTITITLNDILLTDPFLTWHIVFSSFTSSIDWVYVGEVRFLGMDDPPQMTCTTTPSDINVTSQGDYFQFNFYVYMSFICRKTITLTITMQHQA